MTTVVVAGVVLCLVGVTLGIAWATTGSHQNPKAGAATAILAVVMMLILIMVGAALRAVQDLRISQLRSGLNEPPV